MNPSSGDSTLSVGGCYYVSSKIRGLKLKKMDNIYLGPDFTNEYIEKL